MCQKNIMFRGFSLLVVTIFSISTVFTGPVFAQNSLLTQMGLPAVGSKVLPTNTFHSPVLQGININQNNPLQFEFLINHGDQDLSNKQIEEESQKLVNYFLTSLTVSQEEMWVNLSPYESDRIIADNFGQTEMGHALLAQDYMLKQLTSSLMSPDEEVGQNFWARVRAEAKAKFGTDDLPMNTFNKIWILPETAQLYEHAHGVVITEAKMKVMLEEDYVALKHHSAVGENQVDRIETGIESQVIREVLIPAIEKEVNEGQIFAKLRQVLHSMILAHWYKENLKESLLGQVYVDQNKLGPLQVNVGPNQEIYEKYVAAFETGVNNLIKEEYDPETQKVIPRKYFSGGVDNAKLSVETNSSSLKALKYLGAMTLSLLTFGLNSDAQSGVFRRLPGITQADADAVYAEYADKINPTIYDQLILSLEKGYLAWDQDSLIHWLVMKFTTDEANSHFAASLMEDGDTEKKLTADEERTLATIKGFAQYIDRSFTDEYWLTVLNGLLTQENYPVSATTMAEDGSYLGSLVSGNERKVLEMIWLVHQFAKDSERVRRLTTDGIEVWLNNANTVKVKKRLDLPRSYKMNYAETAYYGPLWYGTDGKIPEGFVDEVVFADNDAWHPRQFDQESTPVEIAFGNPTIVPQDGPFSGGVAYADSEGHKDFLQSHADMSEVALFTFVSNLNQSRDNGFNFLNSLNAQVLADSIKNISDEELEKALNALLTPYIAYSLELQVDGLTAATKAAETRNLIRNLSIIFQIADGGYTISDRIKRLINEGKIGITDNQSVFTPYPKTFEVPYSNESGNVPIYFGRGEFISLDAEWREIVTVQGNNLQPVDSGDSPEGATRDNGVLTDLGINTKRHGGIDFNPQNLTTTINNRQGAGFHIKAPQELIERFQDVNGFTPQIIYMQPVTPQVLPIILGMDRTPVEGDNAESRPNEPLALRLSERKT